MGTCTHCGTKGSDFNRCAGCNDKVCQGCYSPFAGGMCIECSERCQVCSSISDVSVCAYPKCIVRMCTACAFEDIDGDLLCDEHSAACGECSSILIALPSRKCQKGCDKFICDDCGKSVSGEIVCHEHHAAECMYCNNFCARSNDFYGCENCAHCEECYDSGAGAREICNKCGYSSYCMICSETNTSKEGDLCKSCRKHIDAVNVPWDLDDEDMVRNYHEYAYDHRFLDAVDPDTIDDNYFDGDEHFTVVPYYLPNVPGENQRILVPLKNGGADIAYTQWGDLSAHRTPPPPPPTEPAKMGHLPEPAVACILWHYGLDEAVRDGLNLVSRLWNSTLRHHFGWEYICEREGIANISRPDGTIIDWGGRYIDYMRSRYTRREMISAILQGKNIFMTGMGGTGKTFNIQMIKERLQAMRKTVYVTATTGMAATLIEGMTIHKWSGMGIGKGDVPTLLKMLGRDARTRWKQTDILIIDEVSMLDPDFFGKLDEIGRRVRGCHTKLFGGIQIIASGDFLQLPAVKPEGMYQHAFQHPKWEDGIDKTFVFNFVYRTTDALFTDVLSRVRLGEPTMEDVEILKTRLHKPLTKAEALGILPTRLYSLRADVDRFNQTKLDELDGEPTISRARVSVSRRDTQHGANGRYALSYDRATKQAESACPVSGEMRYKIGAQVMCVVNLDQDEGIINGSRGVITGIPDVDKIDVLFASGVQRTIEPFSWKHKDARGDRGEAITLTYKQIPLALAWAYTVHKAQGATLDCAVINLGARAFFVPGLAYVALSRVRALETFSLEALDPSLIRADSLVRSYYAYIERHGTHKGFRATIIRLPFPTMNDMAKLAAQLPTLTRQRQKRIAEASADASASLPEKRARW